MNIGIGRPKRLGGKYIVGGGNSLNYVYVYQLPNPSTSVAQSTVLPSKTEGELLVIGYGG